MAEAPRAPDRDAAELLADAVLATAGPGTYIVCGRGGEPLARCLVTRGIDARFAADLPSKGALHCDVALLWHSLDALDAGACAEALKALRAVASRAVLVRTDSRNRESGYRGEKWLEPIALEAGYRKHPLYLHLLPYESREAAGEGELLAFEPLADAFLAQFPLAALAAERDLHMDMLREPGRRADAHVERYRLALPFVRPGDKVVDVACGLGYGSRALHAGSGAERVIGVDESESAIRYATASYGLAGCVEFRRGDAQLLDFLEDHSVDLVVSFETLEHLPEPLRLLDEALRVLRPGGRLVACVPNRWVDESGDDPNPHHHHVYSWGRLRDEVGSRFRIERAYRQFAGGGMVHPDSRRRLAEFSADGEPGEAEWLIVVAMRDPVGAANVPYVESTFTGYEGVSGFHLARFDADYDNPWLVKALVSIGFRFDSRAGLLDMAREVRALAREGSADEGAALCVEAYALLESGEEGAEARAQRCEDLAAYVARAGKRPHEVRWTISNLYVEALLHLVDRRFDAARRCFERCAAMDPAPFSPLLATKTLGAAYASGLLAALAGEPERARELWSGAIRRAKELLSGDWINIVGREDHPVYFGLPEAVLVLGKASKCAYALGALEDLAHRPGRFWVEVSRDMESHAAREARSLRHALAALAESGEQGHEVARLHAALRDRDAAIATQADTIAQMRSAFEEQARTIVEKRLAFDEQERTIAQMRSAFDEQARTIVEKRSAFDEQERTIAQMRSAFDEQERTIAQMRAAFDEQDRNIAELRAHSARLAQAKKEAGR